MDTAKISAGIRSPVTLSTSAIFLLDNITVQGLAFFLPTIVRTIYPDRTTITQQLFTVPPYVVGAFFTVLIPAFSYKLDRRQIFIILCAPMVMVGYAIFLGTTNGHARYGATFLVASSAFALGPLTNSHISANVLSDTARSAAIGTNGNFTAYLRLMCLVMLTYPSYSYVRQCRWFNLNLVFRQERRSELSHRKWVKLRYVEHNLGVGYFNFVVDQAR